MRVVEGVAAIESLNEFLAAVDTISDEYDCTVQAFDARYVVSRAHLERAVELADRAIERDENVARERAVEILLYAAGRRQIDQALAMGVSEGRGPVVIVVDRIRDSDGNPSDAEASAAEALEVEVDAEPTLGEFDEERVREFFGVDDTELAATDGTLVDIVLERVALLDVEK